MADLNKTLLEWGWGFSIQNLQDGLDIFPRRISAQIAGKEAEKVCDTHSNTLTPSLPSIIIITTDVSSSVWLWKGSK